MANEHDSDQEHLDELEELSLTVDAQATNPEEGMSAMTSRLEYLRRQLAAMKAQGLDPDAETRALKVFNEDIRKAQEMFDHYKRRHEARN